METTNNNPIWIGYVRRSTGKQGITLAAQVRRIEEAAKESGATLLQVIEETESGKEADRKGIKLAMALARKHNGVVVVAKYDRLSRDLAFASQAVFHSGVRFNIIGFPPDAISYHLLFGVFFGMAMREAQLISERTSTARQLQCKQIDEQGYYISKDGKKINFKGNPNGARVLNTEATKAVARAARTKKAEENPNNISSANEIRRYLEAGGKRTLQAIADHLTAQGCYTSRGVFHTPKSVSLLCKANNIAIK